MDRSDLLEIEEEMKVYDSSYETKRVEPGCVIDIFIELNSPENSMKGQVLYVCKENETKTDVPAGIAGFITYDVYEKYFKDCLKDQTIEIGSTTITVNEIYANYFTEPFPARSCVEVAKLPKGVLLEVEAIAEI